MSTPSFQDAKKPFVNAGINPKYLVPVVPVTAVIHSKSIVQPKDLGKTPGRYHSGQKTWCGLGGSGLSLGYTEREQAEYASWPTPNVGLMGLAFPGIDSDANNADAAALVDRVVYEALGPDATLGLRLRGTSTRQLYVTCAHDLRDPVRTRRVRYHLADGSEHGFDVLGIGNQYLINGTHPKLEPYHFDPKASLTDPDIVERLLCIDNADAERLLATLEKRVKEAGGGMIAVPHGTRDGDGWDVKTRDPVMSLEAIVEGLERIPNTKETFGTRETFSGVLAGIRAALGKRSYDGEVEDAIREWATHDPVWCDDEYFDKFWLSLDRVYVGQGALDAMFRRNKIFVNAKYVFPDDDGAQVSSLIAAAKQDNQDEASAMLNEVAAHYVIGEVVKEDGLRFFMRSPFHVDLVWQCPQWWDASIPQALPSMLGRIRKIDRYASAKQGLANFLRDLKERHCDVFHFGETRHPAYDKGQIVPDVQRDGEIVNKLNIRPLSQAIREARKPDPDTARSQADVESILTFGKLLFGDMWTYQIDTLAYMAQNPGKRPGHMLFLVGSPGVGKGVWINLCIALFEGVGGAALIDGAKLLSENARRFILAGTEGSRIISIRELPENSKPAEMAMITSQLKQLVDSGQEGDFIPLERKGRDVVTIRNFAYVMISSNYRNALHVEAEDRRIFYVKCGIDNDNKPPKNVYADLVAISQDPTRLAALWRYLQQRDISDYSAFDDPPVSRAKSEQILNDISNDVRRHARAALMQFEASDRTVFDMDEFREVMAEMAKSEMTRGLIGSIPAYAKDRVGKNVELDIGAALKSSKHFAKLDKDLKFDRGTRRLPTVYVRADDPIVLRQLMNMTALETKALVDREYEEIGLPEHPLEGYRT